MKTYEMLSVLDREIELLTAANSHAAAAVLGEAAKLLKEHRQIMYRIEAWWAIEGVHKFVDGAPECMFALRQSLSK